MLIVAHAPARLVLSAALALSGVACGSHSAPPEVVVPAQQPARLSEADALLAADQFVTERFAQEPWFDLKWYPDRRAEYFPKSKEWGVSYRRTPSGGPGDHFDVTVDDATGQAGLIGNA